MGVRVSELGAEWRRLYGCDLEAPMRHAGYTDVRRRRSLVVIAELLQLPELSKEPQ